MFKRKSNLPSPEPDVRLRKRVAVEEPHPVIQNRLAAVAARLTGLAFRISNIPCTMSKEQVLQTLNALPLTINSPGLVVPGGAAHPNVLRWSFAPSAVSIDTGRYMTATVTFRFLPISFQFRGTATSLVVFPSPTSWIIDTHFYGMTPLNTPSAPIVEYASPFSRSPLTS